MAVQSFTPPPSVFPSTTEADEHGLVAVSAEMDLSLLIDAYCNGIFPWTEEPVCWFSPNPRAVFELDRVRLPVRIGKLLRRYAYTVTFDEAFSDVMKICADVPRKHEGSWIGRSFLRDYREAVQIGLRTQCGGLGGRDPRRRALRYSDGRELFRRIYVLSAARCIENRLRCPLRQARCSRYDLV